MDTSTSKCQPYLSDFHPVALYIILLWNFLFIKTNIFDYAAVNLSVWVCADFHHVAL